MHRDQFTKGLLMPHCCAQRFKRPGFESMESIPAEKSDPKAALYCAGKGLPLNGRVHGKTYVMYSNPEINNTH